MIYIENNFEKYFIPGESFILNSTGSTSTITYGIDRHVDSRCRSITIGTDNFNVIFPDTVSYIRSGCDESKTYIDTLLTIHFEKSIQDISTSQKYKDEQRLQWIKENCLDEYQKEGC